MDVKLILAAAVAAASLGAAGAHASTNLLVNGSFETGDETGWTDAVPFQGGFQSSFVTSGPSPVVATFGNTSSTTSVVSGAEDGTYYLANGTPGLDDTISQTFTDVVGQVYRASGYVASDGGLPSDWSLSVDSSAFASESPSAQQGWTYYSGTFVGTGSDTFTITSRNDPNGNYFDNLQVNAVPEPAAWAMMLVGFFALGAGLRSRRPQLALAA